MIDKEDLEWHTKYLKRNQNQKEYTWTADTMSEPDFSPFNESINIYKEAEQKKSKNKEPTQKEDSVYLRDPWSYHEEIKTVCRDL